jgi:predicted glycosyltransferase
LSRKRVFLYVQHLLGIGHLKRAAALAQALAAAGLEVTLASGGRPVAVLSVEGARFVQLPPAAAADLSFKLLVDEHGAPIDDRWRERRREALLAAYEAAAPHVLMLELYPFGRRQMSFELLPLLDAAQASPRRPAIVSSVRDIVGGGRRKPHRQDEMLALAERYFDHVLVHGDPGLISFERTFRHAQRIAHKLHYTGYVIGRAQGAAPRDAAGQGEVIVSAGGSAMGMRLLECAIRARPLTSLADSTWRVLAGANMAAQDFAALAALVSDAGGGKLVLEQARPDFPALLARCALSISQAGYNTMLEVLDAGARAVVAPFAGGEEVEQALRATILAERGLIELLAEDVLTPEALAAAVERAMRRPRPPKAAIDMRGAEKSAELVARWAGERPW